MDTNSNSQIDPEVYNGILDRLNTYSKRVDRLSSFVIAGGMISIGCSLFITAFVGSLGSNDTLIIRIISFISALTLTLIASFNLTTKLSEIRQAWTILNKANYRFKSKILDTEGLLKAYDEAETLVGPVSFEKRDGTS